MTIAEVNSFPLQMTFLPDVAPHMRRAVTHTEQVTLYRVTLACGNVGWGDSILHAAGYGGASDGQEFVGQNALELLRNCLHPGVQMACYDAVGRALAVPAHTLMGRRVRQRVPFAYWTIDLPPDALARQVQHAASLGYTVYKFKCRPWWDPIEQLKAAAEVAPPGFKLWLDFNGHLRDARTALPLLKHLCAFELVGGLESPIPQRDVEGYRRLRAKLDKPIAVHYGAGACHVVSDLSYDPGSSAEVQLREELTDGFVLGGGDVDDIRRTAAVCAEFRKPCWLQTVGTALRAAWTAHLVSTCSAATLSSLSAHDLFERDLASVPRVVDGYLPVPDGPGLGVEVDEAAVEQLHSATPKPDPRRLSTVVYPSGVRWHFAGEQQRHEAFYFGQLPGFVRGIRLELREDDGSPEFADLFARCEQSPVVE